MAGNPSNSASMAGLTFVAELDGAIGVAIDTGDGETKAAPPPPIIPVARIITGGRERCRDGDAPASRGGNTFSLACPDRHP